MGAETILKFSAKTTLHVAEDLAALCSDLAAAEGAARIGLVVDRNVSRHPRVRALAASLAGKARTLEEFEVDAVEPTTDIVDALAARLRPLSLDLLVAVGGGSTLDLAKAVSVIARADAPTAHFHGTGRPLPPSIRKILVPTTAGTGSEVTPGAVLVNTKTAFKRALGGPQVQAEHAVLDAALTLELPPSITASTGMDALTHSIESYTARCANPVTRMFSKEAFRLLFNNIPRALERPGDVDARRNVMLGSALAGFAIYNSDTGACHALAYPLGIYQHVPHGTAVGLIIPHVVRLNASRGCELYGDLLALVDDADLSGSRAARSERFADRLASFPAVGAIGRRLRDFGISPDRLPFLAERGLDLKTALANNPVNFGLGDAEAVLAKAL